MKITWEDGYEKHYQVGASLHGLKHEGQRPKFVTLDKKELSVIETEIGKRWVHMVLLPCLKEPT